MPKKKSTIEADLIRLSEIIEQIEHNETTLENAIKLYKEGLQLSAKCGETLTNYDQEIHILQKENESGQWQKLLQHF